MIYNSSQYPVEIKQIGLKIWKLRDELESTLRERLEAFEGDLSKIDTLSLAKKLAKKDNILPMQRSRPQLKQDQLARGIVTLLDLNMNMISCFSSQDYLSGQTVIIEFLIPRPFFLTGEVLRCYNYGRKSKVISNKQLDFRLHVKWTYAFPNERSTLKKFLKSILPEIPQETDTPKTSGHEQTRGTRSDDIERKFTAT